MFRPSTTHNKLFSTDRSSLDAAPLIAPTRCSKKKETKTIQITKKPVEITPKHPTCAINRCVVWRSCSTSSLARVTASRCASRSALVDANSRRAAPISDSRSCEREQHKTISSHKKRKQKNQKSQDTQLDSARRRRRDRRRFGARRRGARADRAAPTTTRRRARSSARTNERQKTTRKKIKATKGCSKKVKRDADLLHRHIEIHDRGVELIDLLVALRRKSQLCKNEPKERAKKPDRPVPQADAALSLLRSRRATRSARASLCRVF